MVFFNGVNMKTKLKEEQVQIVKPTGKVAKKTSKNKKENFLYTGTDWTFETIQRAYDEIEKIAIEEMKLNVNIVINVKLVNTTLFIKLNKEHAKSLKEFVLIILYLNI